MTLPAAATNELTAGDYHGQPSARLANDHLWLDVLSAAGPRIVRLGLHGSDDNVLAETPDVGWQTPQGHYELFGGHRLWFAPEDPDLVAVPDAHGLSLSVTDTGVRLVGLPDPITGLIRSITIGLDPVAAAVELRHELFNTGAATIELAPWAITQLPLGGVVTLPQPRVTNDHGVRPNRLIVLWPYTSWQDTRLHLSDGECSVIGESGPPMKIGALVSEGNVSFRRNGVILTRIFEPIAGARYADLGCNIEVYSDERFLELEVLGPLTRLAPGNKVGLDERWELTS